MDRVDLSEVKCLWRPDANKKINLHDFRDKINSKFNLKLDTYPELYQWSIDHYAEFWEEVWRFTGIVSSEPYDEVVDRKKNIAEIPEWFHGSRLNFAENLLKFNDDRVAIYAALEGAKNIKTKTYAELRQDVAVIAAALRKMGVSVGDRVVGYMPNCIETVAAMLATSSIGAIWSSTSPDFGANGVLDRFTQIQPKVIFSVNAVIYNGKVHNHLEKLDQVVKGLPDLEKVVIVPLVEGGKLDISHLDNSCLLNEFLETGKEDGKVPPLTFEQLPFNHPLFIMYSSGTTGVPKCMVHSAGGTLIKHLEEHMLQGNLNRNDIMMYYTTTGWMMWNWLVGCLAVGASIVCYDGSPLVPNADVLWDLIDRIGITVLGTGAKWLSVLEEKEVKPCESHNLKSLHTILSTGSPLKPQSFDFVYRNIKEDLLLASITGGTDIIACFAGCNTMMPVYRGEIQTRHLGMAVESWDEGGKPVMDESGELVCLKPFPSMPTHFWNDKEGKKYFSAYFDKFPGVWAHGDYCLINSRTNGIWMFGRSDGTLNPSGVRFGSAEIYTVVEAFKEIQDSLCVGQKSEDGNEERVVLFLKMAPSCDFGPDLVKQVRTAIRLQLSARHVPALVLETKDIPYTQSGKKVEVAVKKIISGQDVKHRGAYSNPDSLDLYKDLEELRGF